ncbi:uncharacterized protein V1510DRAFT_368216 [Dipodascopsis tothii]|uniref:uncharacterized protein n=1 Tax=Dipodascopsis tothii TaxID=44089 RepID=UPI0034CD93CE
MAIEQELARIVAQNVPQPEKIAALTGALGPVSAPRDLCAFLDGLLAGTAGLVISRPVLSAFVDHVAALADAGARQSVLEYTLERLQPSLVTYEEQEAVVREKLAQIYEAAGQHAQAGATLRGMKLESGQRVISDDYRLQIYVRILRNMLEESEAGSDGGAMDQILAAEEYINKAAGLVARSTDEPARVHFKLAQARVFDAKRRFLDACGKFYELSYSPLIDDDEQTVCLSAAISSALLSPAGPARSRMLATLHKDDRIRDTLPVEHSILEKLNFDNLLSAADVDTFLRDARKPIKHQHIASTFSDGSTAVTRAVTEHNLLAASKLYYNIGFSELAALLGLRDSDKAEEYAARMIQQGRLVATIDQIDKLIYFVEMDQDDKGLKQRDAEIIDLCRQVEDIASLIEQHYPEITV